MKSRWDLVARFGSVYDPDIVFFVKMNGEMEFVCTCGGTTIDGIPCKHICFTTDNVVDSTGTVALIPQTPKPPRKYGDKVRQIRWWCERNVQQFMVD